LLVVDIHGEEAGGETGTKAEEQRDDEPSEEVTDDAVERVGDGSPELRTSILQQVEARTFFGGLEREGEMRDPRESLRERRWPDRRRFLQNALASIISGDASITGK
jgi:hypothetical protein